MITPDRLDELETYRVDDDTPDDAKIRVPAGDLRDLVALTQIAREALRWKQTGEVWRLYELLDGKALGE